MVDVDVDVDDDDKIEQILNSSWLKSTPPRGMKGVPSSTFLNHFEREREISNLFKSRKAFVIQLYL